MRIAVMISGRGSDLQSIIDAIEAGLLEDEICLVLSNRSDAYGLERAARNGIETAVVSHRGMDRKEFEDELIDVIDQVDPDLIVLAGFMRMLTPYFVGHYENRILNIHPSLLPSFPGAHGQRDALEYGAKVSGCTVHFVTDEVDGGPIVLQYPVFVREGDDEDRLAARILRHEHQILPFAIKLVSEGRTEIVGRRVRIRDYAPEELKEWKKTAEKAGIQ